MTDVLVTSFAPARGSGAGLRTLGVIAALARSRDVLVRYVSPDATPPDAALAADPRVTLEQIEPGRGPRRAAAVLQARAHGVPPGWARAASAPLVAAGRDLPEHARLIADGPTVAGALLGSASARGGVYLAHNLESAFRPGRAIARFERRLLDGYAETWMPTERDIAGARALTDCALRCVPNVIDVAQVPVVCPPAASPPTALLVADFRYAPNRDGLAYLLDEVMPHVWAARPQLRLLIAGRGLDAPPADPRADALGYVEDLEAQYARAHVACVPLLSGGGSPLKFLEALAHGLPVVATPHAAALIERGSPGGDFLVGQDARAFADLLVSAADGQHAAIGAAGRALALAHYSIDALARVLGP